MGEYQACVVGHEALDLKPLLNKDSRIKVSSTLDKSVGKKYLTDGSPETCWTSQQGLPQAITVAFERPVFPRTLHLNFQGGFVGIRCCVHGIFLASALATEAESASAQEASSERASFELVDTIYPRDINGDQHFDLNRVDRPLNQLKIVFEESSDFFGRITIYDLQIDGLDANIEPGKGNEEK